MVARKPGAPVRHNGLASSVPVSKVMRTQVVGVAEGLTVAELAQCLLEQGVSGVAVLDSQGKAVGVVSLTDIARHQAERCEGGGGASDATRGTTTVAEIMTPFAYTVSPTTSVAQAAALMAFEGIHRVPVTANGSGKVVGVLHALDVVRFVGEQAGYLPLSAAEKAAVA